jgi:tRNA nucleotidyltransferase (CCA-adding enzyme)
MQDNRHGELARDGGDVLAAVAELPGGRELLELADGREDVGIVGGAVRDLLLGRQPRELDVVVAEGAGELATALASRLGARADESADERSGSTFNERFRTARVCWSGGTIDIATRRSESYTSPGALPLVGDGTFAEDLDRRDFTVNAFAVALGGRRRGALLAAEHAREDLAAGWLRVLHDDSFVDDPTRLLRLARYRARLQFEIEPHTATLAREALQGGALASVSRARTGAELRLALGERDPVAALASLQQLGVLAALGAGLLFDASLAATALELLPPDGHPQALLLGALLAPSTQAAAGQSGAGLRALLDEFEFPAAERERVIRSVLAAPLLIELLERRQRPSQLHDALAAHPPEAVALAAALAGRATPAWEAAREWLGRLRTIGLSIGGQDLLDAGIPAGPEIGRRLAAALAAKLDGEIEQGREAELAAALAERA